MRKALIILCVCVVGCRVITGKEYGSLTNVGFSLEWKSIPIKEKPHREFLDINVRKVKECKTLLEAILWPLRRFQRCPRSLLERGGKPLL